ncbi:hypothetical protein HPB50_015526 [Hyalomma asiaticum]|uniref:Uncharacterized protein n=1 Tax=Hyalomma asiaticum TaxID=266040 RepID=A0ACB7S2V5_HYAAI|nr:hypothetical protein HPB50_015526 [Hyalomma asiaticum]
MMLDHIRDLNERSLLCTVEQLRDAMRSGNPGEPRTIFCHDMDGNYKEDRHVSLGYLIIRGLARPDALRALTMAPGLPRRTLRVNAAFDGLRCG